MSQEFSNTSLTPSENIDMSAWASYGLSNDLIRGLSLLGFVEPTEIQKRVLPVAISFRKDVVGAAETGSGKTLAFGLGILNSIIQIPKKERLSSGVLPALILTPTRELALQIVDHLKKASVFAEIDIVGIVGGMAMPKQVPSVLSFNNSCQFFRKDSDFVEKID